MMNEPSFMIAGGAAVKYDRYTDKQKSMFESDDVTKENSFSNDDEMRPHL